MLDLWLRRIHMYAALFLVPWILLYAISTLVMNHRVHFGAPPPKPAFETVEERSFQGTLPDTASGDEIAARLSSEFNMPGRSRVRHDPDGGTVEITGESPFGARRITYRTASGMVTVERSRYGVRRFLSQLHYRVGYEWDSFAEDAWAGSVDLFIFAMLSWLVSGLWMWWPIRSTRRLGMVSLGCGIALFAFFLLAI